MSKTENRSWARLSRVPLNSPLQPRLINTRDSEGIKDKGACSVNALSIVLDIPFTEAQALWAQAGRKRNKGVPTLLVHKLPGLKFVPVIRSPKTIAKFVKMFPVGRFFVRKSHHMFAIVDGKVHDWAWQSPRVRLTNAWRIERKTQ